MERLAAAVMAFSLCANVVFDPTIAVAETVQANQERRGRGDAHSI
jgi:hypothetical protein